MVDRFHCPVQKDAPFSFEMCYKCKFFEYNRSISGKLSAKCRKNREKSYSLSFEAAFWLWRLGMEYQVEIVE